MVPVESTRSASSLFTAQGLGDRVHLITILWALSNKSKEPIRLHFSELVNTTRKRSSFDEILQLVNCPQIELLFHDYIPQSNRDFENYLKAIGVLAHAIYYKDYPGWRERKCGVEVSSLLREIPLISSPIESHNSNVVTAQWDTTGDKRKFSPDEIDAIEREYINRGFTIVTVGGQATEDRFRNSLNEIAGVISNAAFHIGVDSGFMHFAQLYLPPNRIHVYSKIENYWSHHLLRGIDNGMVLNRYYKKPSVIQLQKVRWRYDSPKLLRIWHFIEKYRSTQP